MGDDPVAGFETNRRRLAAIAYRMLGSAAEADDVVQDAFLRWHRTDRAEINDPGAFLARIVTRLCLDRLKEARRRRETYVGTWLPEPLVTEAGFTVDPDEGVSGDISVALLLALDRLSPAERAAFLLHDVFDVGFDEVATILQRSPASCRQLASRARTHIREERPRYSTDPAEQQAIADAFFAASRSGDSGALARLLAETATLHSDGGGRKPAALNVLSGAGRVVRFLVGVQQKWGQQPPRFARRLELNGLPGQLTVEADGTVQTVALAIDAGRVAAVYITRNPDKLRHLEALVTPEVPGALPGA
ncbi:sigma-70 family RNA polymerase sigma factor [Amorphus sp. MBR-141]